MRVLILSAILACAVAAPSGIAPVALAIPAHIPTIDPGDLQAAAINAKVFVEDQAQAAIDRARDLAEQSVEVNNDKVLETNDLVKEKSQEAYWQAIDAVKTAEAKLEGSIANNAQVIARSAFNGAIVPSAISTYITSPIVPGVISPISPIVYAAPVTKTEKEAEKEKEVVKSAEEEKSEKPEEEKKEPEKEKLAYPVFTPLALTPGLKLNEQWLTAPITYFPGQYANTLVHPFSAPFINPTPFLNPNPFLNPTPFLNHTPLLTPTILKTVA